MPLSLPNFNLLINIPSVYIAVNAQHGECIYLVSITICIWWSSLTRLSPNNAQSRGLTWQQEDLMTWFPPALKYVSQDLVESTEGFREQPQGNWILVAFKNPFSS